MKKYVKSSSGAIPTIYIQMFLRPIFYEDFGIAAAIEFDESTRKRKSDNNPSRIINGPLSGPGEELESDIEYEYNRFIQDCKFLIETPDFTIIHSERSDDSKKSEYILMFGMKDKPCGRIVFDLRISDHALEEYHFPDNFKKLALEYLKMNNVLSGEASEAGIDFQVEKVLVGNVKNDTWDRALNRLFGRLRTLRNKVRIAERRYPN